MTGKTVFISGKETFYEIESGVERYKTDEDVFIVDGFTCQKNDYIRLPTSL